MVRILRKITLGAVFLLALGKAADIAAPEPQVGHWRSEGARGDYLSSYRAVLSGIDAPTHTRDIPTDFGTARATIWQGPEGSGNPVLLVPGRASGAPMWAENLPSWIGARTIVALDPIGDAGLSTQSTPFAGPEDQARWISQAVHALDLGPVHVVGHSFGGATATEFALADPGQVTSLALLEPVMVARPMPPSIYFWAAIASLPTPQAWRDRAFAEIGGTTVQEVQTRTPMSEMISSASRAYSPALPLPRTLSDEQWRNLRMPLRLDIGANSSIAGGEGSISRINALIPTATTVLWPEASHSLPMDERDRIGAELTLFWEKSERGEGAPPDKGVD